MSSMKTKQQILDEFDKTLMGEMNIKHGYQKEGHEWLSGLLNDYAQYLMQALIEDKPTPFYFPEDYKAGVEYATEGFRTRFIQLLNE